MGANYISATGGTREVAQGRFPGRAARRGLDRAAALPPGAAGGGDQLGAHRRRGLRRRRAREGARPQGAEPGAASLYRDRSKTRPDRLRGRRRPRVQPRPGVPCRRPQGRGGIGATPPVRLAETLAAYERGEINVLINAMLLAEGWNSPRATVVMHLAPTASRRVYQQRIGRIMRMHPRKEAGIVVDFVNKGATHSERVVTLHSLLDTDFYREGHASLPPRAAASSAGPPKADAGAVARPRDSRRAPTAGRHRPRVAANRPQVPRRGGAALLGDVRRTGRALRGARRAREELHRRRAGKGALEQFLFTCAAENPNRRLRLMALADRVPCAVDRAAFDDLVTLVTETPPWEKDRLAGGRMLLQAIAQDKPDAPEQILARWTWRLARAPARRRIAPPARSSPRQAAAGRARELTGSPARGECGEARRGCPRAAAAVAPRCWRRPRATRRARRSSSTRPAKIWGPCRKSPPRSPRTSRSQSLPAARAGAGAARSAAQEQTSTPNGSEATPAAAAEAEPAQPEEATSA